MEQALSALPPQKISTIPHFSKQLHGSKHQPHQEEGTFQVYRDTTPNNYNQVQMQLLVLSALRIRALRT